MSIRCHSCKLYNFATAETCRRCHAALVTSPQAVNRAPLGGLADAPVAKATPSTRQTPIAFASTTPPPVLPVATPVIVPPTPPPAMPTFGQANGQAFGQANGQTFEQTGRQYHPPQLHQSSQAPQSYQGGGGGQAAGDGFGLPPVAQQAFNRQPSPPFGQPPPPAMHPGASYPPPLTYGNAYGNPQANPYANPQANPYLNPHGNPYARNPGAPYLPLPPRPYTTPASDSSTAKKVFAALGVVLLLCVLGLRVLLSNLTAFSLRDAGTTALRGDPTGEKTLPISFMKFPEGGVTGEAALREKLRLYIEGDPMYGGEEMAKLFFSGTAEAEELIWETSYDRKSGDVLVLMKFPLDVPPQSEGASATDFYDPLTRERVAAARLRQYLEARVADPAQLVNGEAFRAKHRFDIPETWRARMSYGLRSPYDYLVATPLANLNISDNALFAARCNLRAEGGDRASVEYAFSGAELAGFMANTSTYGGALRILDEDFKQRQINIVANHGAFVAKRDEPSLSRLLRNLTAGGAHSREEKVQLLLDVASSAIAYDNDESRSRGEVLKRPNETLISRRGDCSSKTILLASLLEQAGEDYLLVYYKDHINVAVPAGNFRVTNGLTFNWEEKPWVIAETTVPGFRIGETLIERQMTPTGSVANRNLTSEIELVQRPSAVGSVFDFQTKKPVRLV